MDMMGRIITNADLPQVLNQTYEVKGNNQSAGIYLLRLQIGNRFYAHKIYLN
jgi:hypothetical protein